MQEPRALARVALITAACALPRLAYAWLAGPPSPNVYHWTLSGGLMRDAAFSEAGVPTAAHDVLYPAFLAIARAATGDSVAGVLVLQILVACAGAVLLDRLATAMSGRWQAGMMAAMWFAFYPYLIRQSAAWTELTLLSTLLIAGWLAFARGWFVAAVALLALAALTRATVLPIVVLALALVAARAPRRTLVAAAAAAALVLVPWGVRNHRVAGTPWPSRQGQILFAGNNPYARAMIPRHDMDLFIAASEEMIDSRLSEGERRRAYTRAALDYIGGHPWTTIWSKARNAVYLFHPRLVPFQPAGPESSLTLLPDGQVVTRRARVRAPVQELAHSVVYTGILLAAVLGIYERRHRWRSDALLIGSIVAFVAVAAVYFPTTRIRAPIDPLLMAYASCAMSAFLGRLNLASDAVGR